MYLRDILQHKGRQIHTICSSASCGDVVRKLVRLGIGSLIVRDSPDRSILGIVTERDILRAHAAHWAPLDHLPVAEVMSRRLVTAQPDHHIMLAMQLMTKHRVRHLPVVQSDELCGLVSIGDIVKAFHDELEVENHCLLDFIQGDVGELSAPLA
jgi:CBS domain-containing protein